MVEGASDAENNLANMTFDQSQVDRITFFEDERQPHGEKVILAQNAANLSEEICNDSRGELLLPTNLKKCTKQMLSLRREEV